MPKLAFEFNPFKKSDAKLTREAKSEAVEEIREFVIGQVLSDIGSGKTPVKGGSWKRGLSKEYKATKDGRKIANLEESGELLDALDVKIISNNKLSLEVPSGQFGKADGNNRGTYGKGSRTNSSQARTFIPHTKNQDLSQEIWDGINAIISDFEDIDE